MSHRRQQLKKLARIALLLLIGATVGLLAGQVDDGDENFGFASLEPGVVHRLNRKSEQGETPTSVRAEFSFVEPDRLVPTPSELAAFNNSRATCVPSLAIPLRT